MLERCKTTAVCLFLALSACDGDDEMMSSSSSTAGQAETTAAGEDSTAGDDDETASGSESTGAAGGSESTGAGEPLCELPEDDVLDAGTTITIENATDAPRYISPYSSFLCNYGQLEVLIDGEPVLWDHERAYPQRCTDCAYGCSDGGMDGLVIAPGQTAEIAWNGGYWGDETLSEACGTEICDGGGDFEPTGVPAQCQALRAMEALEYTARVHVFDTCPDGLAESDACDCPDGVCETFFYEPTEGEYTAEATAVFPAGAAIVLE